MVIYEMLGLARFCRPFEYTSLEKAYGKKGDGYILKDSESKHPTPF